MENGAKLVHGVWVNNLNDELIVEIEYAKTSIIPKTTLYEVYGKIKMAHQLKAITTDQYLELSHQCIVRGINNPKYF